MQWSSAPPRTREFLVQRSVNWWRWLTSVPWSLALARIRELPAELPKWWRGVRAMRWTSAPSRTREFLAQRSVNSWRRLSAVRLSVAQRRFRELWIQIADWWRGLGRRWRYSLVAGLLLAAMGIPFAFFTWSGVSDALEARQAYRDLQGELSHMTPVDLIQVEVYQSLEGRFQRAEEASARARSRLAFLKVFSWVPVLGGRIKEAHLLLDMGFYQGRAGRNLANTYRRAIATPLDSLETPEDAQRVARVLTEEEPRLNQIQEDLRRVALLRKQLGATERSSRYGVLVDRYLPAIQAVAYLSPNPPKDTDGRREDSGRGWVRELQGRWPGVLG